MLTKLYRVSTLQRSGLASCLPFTCNLMERAESTRGQTRIHGFTCRGWLRRLFRWFTVAPQTSAASCPLRLLQQRPTPRVTHKRLSNELGLVLVTAMMLAMSLVFKTIPHLMKALMKFQKTSYLCI